MALADGFDSVGRGDPELCGTGSAGRMQPEHGDADHEFADARARYSGGVAVFAAVGAGAGRPVLEGFAAGAGVMEWNSSRRCMWQQGQS